MEGGEVRAGFRSLGAGNEPRTGGRSGIGSPSGEAESLAGKAMQGRAHLNC